MSVFCPPQNLAFAYRCAEIYIMKQPKNYRWIITIIFIAILAMALVWWYFEQHMYLSK